MDSLISSTQMYIDQIMSVGRYLEIDNFPSQVKILCYQTGILTPKPRFSAVTSYPNSLKRLSTDVSQCFEQDTQTLYMEFLRPYFIL